MRVDLWQEAQRDLGTVAQTSTLLQYRVQSSVYTSQNFICCSWKPENMKTYPTANGQRLNWSHKRMYERTVHWMVVLYRRARTIVWGSFFSEVASFTQHSSQLTAHSTAAILPADPFQQCIIWSLLHFVQGVQRTCMEWEWRFKVEV